MSTGWSRATRTTAHGHGGWAWISLAFIHSHRILRFTKALLKSKAKAKPYDYVYDLCINIKVLLQFRSALSQLSPTAHTRHIICIAIAIGIGIMVRSSVLVFTSFRLGNSVRMLVRLVFTSRELEINTAARVGTRMCEFMRSNNS